VCLAWGGVSLGGEPRYKCNVSRSTSPNGQKDRQYSRIYRDCCRIQYIYSYNKRPFSCDGAGARHLVRGSLKTWRVYIDVASPPSLAPQLNIFVIQHSLALSCKHLVKPPSRHLFNGSSRHISSNKKF